MSLIDLISSRRSRTDERGATAIVIALAATVMLGAGALAVDVGQVYTARAELQQAVDKAAVAAASQLDGTSVCTDDAKNEARKLLAANWPRTAGNKLTAASISLDGTPSGGSIDCATTWTLKLTAPTARVDYGLARAVTSSAGVDVPATATAGLYSPGTIINGTKVPKVMPGYAANSAACTYGSHVLFQSPRTMNLDPCNLSEGNFGNLKFPRTVNLNENAELATNIAAGPDFTMTTHPVRTSPITCSAANSVVSVMGSLRDGTNCLDTLRGYRSNAAEDGLINGIGTYKGLLNAPTSTRCNSGLLSGIVTGLLPRSDLTLLGKQINNDRLECFIDVKLSDLGMQVGDLARGDYSGPVVLNKAIMESPRFVWIPVIGAIPPVFGPLLGEDTVTGGNGYYKIVDFRPGFIMDVAGSLSQVTCTVLGACNGLNMVNGKLDSVDVFLFSPKTLPKQVWTRETTTYIGVGPKVVRLVD